MKPLRRSHFYWEKETVTGRIDSVIRRLSRNKPIKASLAKSIASRYAYALSGNPNSTLRSCYFMDLRFQDDDEIINGINETAKMRFMENSEALRKKRVQDDLERQYYLAVLLKPSEFVFIEFVNCEVCGKSFILRKRNGGHVVCRKKMCKEVLDIATRGYMKIDLNENRWEWVIIYSLLKYLKQILKDRKNDTKTEPEISKNRNLRRPSPVSLQYDCRN